MAMLSAILATSRNADNAKGGGFAGPAARLALPAGTIRPWLLVLVAISLTAVPAMARQDDDPVAINLHSTGIKAFEQQEYELAIDQWNKLLQDFPDYSARQDVKYFVGQSWFNLKDYSNAAAEFLELRESIPVIANYRNGPALLVFLGFSQYSVGRASDQEADAIDRLQKAVATYQSFFDNFPEDDLADQAWFFHGEALNQLNQIQANPDLLDRAAASYRKVVEDFPDSDLQSKALSELGGCYEQAGNYPEALVRYEEFGNRFADDELAPVVALRAAETIRKLGMARQNAGDNPTAEKHFQDALARYQPLLETEGFPQRDLALYSAAWCQLQLSQLQAAADSFARLANDFPDSRYAADSALSAGKFYFSSKNLPRAAQWLQTVIAGDPDNRDEATHWLCRVHLENGEYSKALELASTATADGGGGAHRANLLMDAGDALHEIPDRRDQAIPLYLAVASEFPDSPLAPKALYYAAFANMTTGAWADAIRDAQQFKARYPQDELLPATLQVLGESALKVNELPLAQSTFEDLIQRFPNDKSGEWWRTRVGWALYLQDRHDDAVAWLSSSLVNMNDPVSRSEANFVMGSSQFRLEDYPRAIESLQLALRDNAEREDADQVRLLLVRAHYQLQQLDPARQIAREILNNSLDEATHAAARYWLGEIEYRAENYPASIENYTAVIVSDPPAKLLPDALYGRAWGNVKLGEPAAAIADFDRLLDEFPDHSTAQQALIGRAVARRGAAQFQLAIADLDAFLASGPSDEDRWQAIYERGLCHVGLEQWDETVADLGSLADNLDAQNPLADNLLYELAWAWKKKPDAAQAALVFQRLADGQGTSEFAAEANYHVAESLYQAGDYAGASARYRQSLDHNPNPDVGERAAYKLAWCSFEQQQWDDARRLFAEQVERYPDGPLNAIGLSMVAESLFQNKNHADAVTAYKVAIPAIRTAAISEDSVRILAPLHAAQSANKTGDYEAAQTYARSVIDEFPDSGYQYAAMYELGAAQLGLDQTEQAIETWQTVAEKSLDKIGARARAMVGDEYFKAKDYDRAIREFKLVMYGYPVQDGNTEIDPWRTFAAYETARCYYVQINDAAPDRRPQLIRNSREWFQYLVDNFPNDALAPDARKQLDLLDQLN